MTVTLVYERSTPPVGRQAQVRKTLTVADLSFFTGLSGNMHPLYVNALHAGSATGGERLMFEFVLAALASNALGELGGPYRRIASVALSFPEPVRVGDTIAALAEVEAIEGSALRCTIACRRDGSSGLVAEGAATLVDVGAARS